MRSHTTLVSFSSPLAACDYPEASLSGQQKLFERSLCKWLGISIEGLKFYFIGGIIQDIIPLGKYFR